MTFEPFFRPTFSIFLPVIGGGVAITDITYANLVTAIGGSTLTAGAFYRITDYATKHYIVDGGNTQYLTGDGIITGTTEPLIVLATSTNTIDKQAYSPAYPEDVIYYDWNPANWIDDLSFADMSGTPVIISDFKGVITFRHDTLLDNYAGFDWRECKFRRWKTNVTAWDSGTAYVAKDLVLRTDFIFIALRGSTNKEPLSETTYWIKLFNLSQNEFWNATPGTWLDIPTDDVNYSDFKLFAEGTGTATYELCCRSNHFDSFKDDSVNFDSVGSLLPNTVIFLMDAGYYSCYSNNIKSEYFHNTIYGSFNANNIGQYFSSNIIDCSGGFFENTIGNYCKENIFYEYFYMDIVGGGFEGNRLGSNFDENKVGYKFQNNIINESFKNNSIEDNFKANYINSSFQKNIVSNKVLDTVDLSTATHVYADYTCWIYKNSAGNARLKYIDGSDVIQYAAPTA